MRSMAAAAAPALEQLPAGFAGLTLESAGSPAPWTTVVAVPLRPRVLLLALVTLSRALGDSNEQGAILAAALDRAHAAYEQQRLTVAGAKDAVLESSKAAQVAHAEARRVEKLGKVFKDGADRAVGDLDRAVLRLVREGTAVKELQEAARRIEHAERGGDGDTDLQPYRFVAPLVNELGLDVDEVVGGQGESALNEEWQAIEDGLVSTLADRIYEKASPRRAPPLRLPRLSGRGRPVDDGASSDAESARANSLPPTPPASVHSSDPGDRHEDVDEADEPNVDMLSTLLVPLIHPVVSLLFRLHSLLEARLTHAVDRFESLVRASSAAVDGHRLAVQRLNKYASKLRDLRLLEAREVEEEGRVMDELRDTVVELAKLRLGVPPSPVTEEQVVEAMCA
ncbi:uncharacterized protein JCM10292_003350 [Rhodotorula paludigena]|uniref:uncharacterized protein n=1 Tax=Rhodotorula paludigena TaxID=86838 RepID=UPI00316D95D5